MPTVLSAKNPRIGLAHDLTDPAARRERGAMLIEGFTMIDEARRSGRRPSEIFVEAGEAERQGRALTLYEEEGSAVFVVPPAAVARLSDLRTERGVVATVPIPADDPARILAGDGPVLLLAGVNDPGNAGTLVRSAEAFGAAGVLFGRGGADPFGAKVVRATMGSIFRVPVATIGADDLLAAAQASGRPIVATDLAGEDIRDATLPRRAIIAVGNERRGVRDWLPRWDLAIRIPQREGAESLNAAVAGSIVLYETSRVK